MHFGVQFCEFRPAILCGYTSSCTATIKAGNFRKGLVGREFDAFSMKILPIFWRNTREKWKRKTKRLYSLNAWANALQNTLLICQNFWSKIGKLGPKPEFCTAHRNILSLYRYRGSWCARYISLDRTRSRRWRRFRSFRFTSRSAHDEFQRRAQHAFFGLSCRL